MMGNIISPGIMNKTSPYFHRQKKKSYKYNLVNAFQDYLKRSQINRSSTSSPQNLTKYKSLRNKRKSSTIQVNKLRLHTQNCLKGCQITASKRKLTKEQNSLLTVTPIQVIYLNDQKQSFKNTKEKIKTQIMEEMKKAREKVINLKSSQAIYVPKKSTILRYKTQAQVQCDAKVKKKVGPIRLMSTLKKRTEPNKTFSSKRPFTADIGSNRLRTYEIEKESSKVWEGNLEGWQHKQFDDF